MIDTKDINALHKYFKELETIPEGMEKVINKIELLNKIQEANDELVKLMKESD